MRVGGRNPHLRQHTLPYPLRMPCCVFGVEGSPHLLIGDLAFWNLLITRWSRFRLHPCMAKCKERPWGHSLQRPSLNATAFRSSVRGRYAQSHYQSFRMGLHILAYHSFNVPRCAGITPYNSTSCCTSLHASYGACSYAMSYHSSHISHITSHTRHVAYPSVCNSANICPLSTWG